MNYINFCQPQTILLIFTSKKPILLIFLPLNYIIGFLPTQPILLIFTSHKLYYWFLPDFTISFRQHLLVVCASLRIFVYIYISVVAPPLKDINVSEGVRNKSLVYINTTRTGATWPQIICNSREYTSGYFLKIRQNLEFVNGWGYCVQTDASHIVDQVLSSLTAENLV